MANSRGREEWSNQSEKEDGHELWPQRWEESLIKVGNWLPIMYVDKWDMILV